MRTRRVAGLVVMAVLLVGAACGSKSGTSGSSSGGTGDPSKLTVGFIFVGPKDDFGYNQAAYQGSQALKTSYPGINILTAENVTEDDSSTRVMESMINRGAKVIFATSYGHKDFAVKVAKAHPEVVVVQQGNFIPPEQLLPNIGTYFGTVYEPVFLAGMAAGASTKTNKLGYVYAFPIPQTIANIDAFALGAKRTNPQATVYTVATSSWCNPGKQAEAARSLLAQGVDVLTQHQDCTSTVIRTAEEAGKLTVGYHADASSQAPRGWLTGSEWNWGPLYTDIVKTIAEGKFTGSKYNANYRSGCKDGNNPFVQSKFGPSVSAQTQSAIASAKQEICTTSSPFAGPVSDQAGTVRIAAGTVPTYAQLEDINWLVSNVIGSLAGA